jgi:transposase
MSDTELLPKSEPVRRLEVFTGAGRRRRWTAEEKARIIAETCAPEASVCAVARRHGLTPQQLFAWRRDARQRAAAEGAKPGLAFASVVLEAPRSSPSTARNFRKGMDGLAALVRESLGADPYSGVVYVFRAKRTDRVKLLLWDGTGLVLVGKRLEKSSFRWPTISDGVMRLTSSQLSALLEGLDWTRVRAVRVQAPQATL